MGCKSSSESSAAHSRSSSRPARDDSSVDDGSSAPVFGSGVHVGRAGNVDLSGRELDVLGPHMVNMINEDDLHRTATSLTLSNNKLYALAKELPLLTNLRELDIDHNRFQRFPEVLVRLPRLWRINASFNPIENVRGFDVLPRLVSLKSLSVRDCGLKEIPMAIIQCEMLEELDIGNNPEIKITGVALHRLARLKKLAVANCNLGGRTLPNTIKRMKLSSLDISGNSFTFNDPHFFGSNLPRTLVELHLVDMKLTAPPAVIALLKHLNFLDLAENPIETLDVLAGRVIKRLPHVSSNGTVATNGTNALTEIPEEEEENDFNEEETTTQVSGGGVSNTTSRVSLSKVSKAGIMAHVTQPIPLKKLSLRACGLQVVPKYFHKLDHLEELDLSENENLDDPNMTLFSLQNLVSLNIIGCPFAEDPSQSRNEWFDIGKLRDLRSIQWEVWKSEHNMSPYRTKIPIELCGLKLKSLNEVQLRKNLFTGDIIQTVINLLSDGYFKVDLSVDEMVLFSHLAAVKSFADTERFFFPKAVTESPGIDCGISPESLGEVFLRIAVSRYIFFLAMQAANYDAVIIPPLDVMVIHYAQLTTDPLSYRVDCEAVCGRILNCNYRTFFAEQKKHQAEAKSVVDASRRIWNLMVRSAQRDLAWLRYDFWDKRLHTAKDVSGSAAGAGAASSDAGVPAGSSKVPAGVAGTTTTPASTTTKTTTTTLSDSPTAVPKSLPLLIGKNAAEVTQDWQALLTIDSAGDLAGVLDQAITSHFSEKGVHEFANSIATFFNMNRCFIRHEESLWRANLDWTRYVKFLTLYAYRCAVLDENNAYVIEPVADEEGNPCPPTRTTSMLGKHYDKMIDHSFSSSTMYLPQSSEMPGATAAANGGVGEEGISAPQTRTPSGIRRRSPSSLLQTRKSNRRFLMVQQLEGNPVPTIGIAFMLHAHRTSQLKYYQSLSLFAIENVDVTWGTTTDRILKQTQGAWMALYDEAYVSENKDMPFGYTIQDGVLMPSNDPWLNEVSSPATVTAKAEMKLPAAKHCHSYSAAAKPGPSVMRVKSKKSGSDVGRGVTFCSADTEFGVF